MIKALLILAFLCCLPLSSIHAAMVSFESDIASGTFSNSLPWPVDGSFTFEAGVFEVGFTPNSTNTDLWQPNWNSLGSTSWLDDDGDNYFSGIGSYSDNLGPWAIGSKLYIWGFNSRDLGTNEWILLFNTDSDWNVVSSDQITPVFLSTTDDNVVAIIGSISGGGTVFQSALVSVVPEPSICVLLGFGIGALYWLRRRARVLA